MVSPEHIDEQKPENKQAPSPAVKQQVPTEVEKKRVWLKRVAGIVLTLVGSFAIAWAVFVFPFLQTGPDFVTFIFNLTLILGVFLLGVVSAVLFRSWWALLVVPIAFALGEFLAFYLIPLVISPNPFGSVDMYLEVLVWAPGPILALFGALIGATIIMRADKALSATMPKDF